MLALVEQLCPLPNSTCALQVIAICAVPPQKRLEAEPVDVTGLLQELDRTAVKVAKIELDGLVVR